MKLPRFLRDSSLLELLDGVDGDFARQNKNGSFTIEVHYGAGKPQAVHVDAPPIIVPVRMDLTETEIEA